MIQCSYFWKSLAMKKFHTVHNSNMVSPSNQNMRTCLFGKKTKWTLVGINARLSFDVDSYRGSGLVIVSQSNLATIKNSVITMDNMTQDWRPNVSQSL